MKRKNIYHFLVGLSICITVIHEKTMRQKEVIRWWDFYTSLEVILNRLCKIRLSTAIPRTTTNKSMWGDITHKQAFLLILIVLKFKTSGLQKRKTLNLIEILMSIHLQHWNPSFQSCSGRLWPRKGLKRLWQGPGGITGPQSRQVNGLAPQPHSRVKGQLFPVSSPPLD